MPRYSDYSRSELQARVEALAELRHAAYRRGAFQLAMLYDAEIEKVQAMIPPSA